MSTSGTTPSFARDIAPLFRDRDRSAMRWRFDLGSYQDVRAHAQAILGRLANGSMPCDTPWPEDRIALFRQWVEAGMPA